MSKKGPKMNTYIKYTMTMVVVLVVSGALGFISACLHVESWDSVFHVFLELIRSNMALIMLALSVFCFIYEEIILRKMKELAKQIPDAEDAEGDRLEFEMEQVGSAGLIASNLFSVLSIMVLSTGYSLDYIYSLDKKENAWLLAAFLIFTIGTAYQGYWQVRYVKAVQRAYPDKKGDPSSRKFQEQWLQSCDEAEREVIYLSAYNSYKRTSRLLPALALAALLSHLMWDTGILAVFMICIIWFVMVVIYCRSCVIQKSRQIK